ncbi:hypothetical protein ACYU03_00485 [Pseudomonas sp. X10]
MNRNPVTRVQTATLPLRQVLFLSLALMLTLMAGQLYHSWQTARLAQQVAAQTALLTQIQATRASVLQAADRLPPSDAAPATVNSVVPQERWVF